MMILESSPLIAFSPCVSAACGELCQQRHGARYSSLITLNNRVNYHGI